MTGGYVEPRPEVYSSVIKFARDLKTVTGLGENLRKKVAEFENLVNSLRSISEKEIAERKLTEEENQVIFNATRNLEAIAEPPEILRTGTEEGAEKPDFSVIVDVHRDPQTNQVLQEGIGKPFDVSALVRVNGTVKLVRGGTYSYYEFTRNSGEVLINRSWRELVQREDPPPLPDWISPLISQTVQ